MFIVLHLVNNVEVADVFASMLTRKPLRVLPTWFYKNSNSQK